MRKPMKVGAYFGAVDVKDPGHTLYCRVVSRYSDGTMVEAIVVNGEWGISFDLRTGLSVGEGADLMPGSAKIILPDMEDLFYNAACTLIEAEARKSKVPWWRRLTGRAI